MHAQNTYFFVILFIYFPFISYFLIDAVLDLHAFSLLFFLWSFFLL